MRDADLFVSGLENRFTLDRFIECWSSAFAAVAAVHLAKHLPGAAFRAQSDLASLLFGVSVLGLRLQ